jgi:hypothetical protein
MMFKAFIEYISTCIHSNYFETGHNDYKHIINILLVLLIHIYILYNYTVLSP